MIVGNFTEERTGVQAPSHHAQSDRTHYDLIEIEPNPITTYYQYPDMIVRFFVEVVNAFESAFMELPGRAPQDMIAMLIKRGYDLARKYGAENLVQIHPGQIIRHVWSSR